MQITIEYAAQLKRAAGIGRETVELDQSATLRDLISALAQRHGHAWKSVLLDASGNLHPSMLVFVNDEQCRDDAGRELTDGDRVALLPPISGG